MIVDAYVHCGQRKFLPFEAWEKDAAASGVEGAFLVQHMGEYDNRYLAGVAARSPNRFKVAGLLETRSEKSAEYLTGLLDSTALGIRFIGLRMNRPMIESGAEHLAILDRFGGTIVLHLEDGIPPHVKFLERLARDYPNTTLYVPHLGWPTIDGRVSHGWSEAVRRLAGCERVVFGLSSAHHFSARPFPHEDIWHCVGHVLQEVGSDRAVWASGFPQFLDTETFAENLGLFLGETFNLEEDDRRAVLGGNAMRIWGFRKENASPEAAGRG